MLTQTGCNHERACELLIPHRGEEVVDVIAVGAAVALPLRHPSVSIQGVQRSQQNNNIEK